MTDEAFYRLTELDATNWPEIRDQILRFEHDAPLGEPRSYPGYPHWQLDRVKPRWWPSLDRTLHARRCLRRLGKDLPTRRTLSRLLHFAHGVNDSLSRGPTPSSGGLQSLELYVVNFADGWLPAGGYHFDRLGHHLSQLHAGSNVAEWKAMAPSLSLVDGGALFWILVGDGARIEAKYGPRGYRFLLLEAGHLMQNLCLLSASLGMCTVPLGGFFERAIAKALQLPDSDVVAYTGIAGLAQ
jgi:SagB-type dehydrogenase family enzyme